MILNYGTSVIELQEQELHIEIWIAKIWIMELHNWIG